MNIVIGSAFRNSAHYVPRYLDQVSDLKLHAGPDHNVRVIAVEGDSTDRTESALLLSSMAKHIQLSVVKHEHGQPWFGSTENPERLKALSEVGNTIFNAVRDDDDVLVYVESDLLWDFHTIGSLIDMAVRRDGGFDVFAPMIFAGAFFYDIWGFRKNGERFVPMEPYHIGMQKGLTELDSAGSCLVMRAEVAHKCRIQNDYCLVGWCEDARSKGFKIAMHSDFIVRHPA